jgi:hypothetical protein
VYIQQIYYRLSDTLSLNHRAALGSIFYNYIQKARYDIFPISYGTFQGREANSSQNTQSHLEIWDVQSLIRYLQITTMWEPRSDIKGINSG